MTIVWQYGSNVDEERLNSQNRLKGSAKFIGLAIKRGYRLAFTHTNKHGIGVSDIIESAPDDYVIGCLYEIRHSEMPKMDEIEGVNSGAYMRVPNFVVTKLGEGLKDTPKKISATTYIVVKKKNNPRTDSNYANHILRGIKEHKMGEEYFNKVKAIILKNNAEIEEDLVCYLDC